LPRNIMELMANNKKIIATNIRGNKDLIINEKIGLLVEIGDEIDTAKKIELLYSQKNTNCNNENFIEKYSIENINSEILKIY
ncbi:glycosyltransferase, partial [Clostridium perfringens]